MSSHSSSMRTFRSSDSASEIGSSETSFSEQSQPYFALCSPRSKSSVNVSNSGGGSVNAGPGSTVGGSSSMSSGINHNNNNNANSNNFKQSAAQQPPAVAYHHQPCRRSSSAKAANKPRPIVRRDLGHVNSFPDAHHNVHHKTPPGGGSSSTSYYTPPRSPSLSVTTPTDGPPRRSPTTPSSSAVFKFPSSAITASSSSGGSAIAHHYGRSGGTNPNTPRTLPRSPSTGSAATSTSYNTNSDSACNTHRSASDLTECSGEDISTMPASVSRPSSPRGRGLAYLASRRSSRDSQFSNEELAPLNFNATVRGRQRRTSNFLELPESDEISIRTNMIPNLKRGLIESLQRVLRKNNHLIQSFRSNLESRSFDELQNFKLIIHADRVPQDEHRGQYNAPTIDEVAVLLVNEDKGPRDIVLHGRGGHLSRVSELNRSYDALQYPLMYTRGEDGYHINILQQNIQNRTKTVSCMQFYSYRFMVRETSLNHLQYYKTFSQFAVDMMAKMISERLHFICNHQKQLHADDYVHEILLTVMQI
ncbi:hypothetical protein QTP88_026728 [Uroleucon formosanum]